MIRKTIPVLTHVDNLNDINLDMSAQEQSLSQIDTTTKRLKLYTENIQLGQKNEAQLLNNIIQGTTSIQTSVGLPADESTATTVIGLLKSIVNKLS